MFKLEDIKIARALGQNPTLDNPSKTLWNFRNSLLKNSTWTFVPGLRKATFSKFEAKVANLRVVSWWAAAEGWLFRMATAKLMRSHPDAIWMPSEKVACHPKKWAKSCQPTAHHTQKVICVDTLVWRVVIPPRGVQPFRLVSPRGGHKLNFGGKLQLSHVYC